nr:hypothetical protein [Streptomyces collinus]
MDVWWGGVGGWGMGEEMVGEVVGMEKEEVVVRYVGGGGRWVSVKK